MVWCGGKGEALGGEGVGVVKLSVCLGLCFCFAVICEVQVMKSRAANLPMTSLKNVYLLQLSLTCTLGHVQAVQKGATRLHLDF